ncbi:MAG: hypothetical protein WCF66_07030, partial [Pseudolabrys sp.]
TDIFFSHFCYRIKEHPDQWSKGSGPFVQADVLRSCRAPSPYYGANFILPLHKYSALRQINRSDGRLYQNDCPLLAQSGHRLVHCACPLSG